MNRWRFPIHDGPPSVGPAVGTVGGSWRATVANSRLNPLEAVTLGPRENRLPGPAVVPREAVVARRLVPDLEAPERMRSELRQERARLRDRDRGHARLEVDPHDHPRVKVSRKPASHSQPARRQGVADTGRAPDSGRRPPGGVAAVAPDSQHRRLPRREVADQLLEHRVHRVRIPSRVPRDGRVLQRQSNESGRDLSPDGVPADRHDRVGPLAMALRIGGVPVVEVQQRPACHRSHERCERHQRGQPQRTPAASWPDAIQDAHFATIVKKSRLQGVRY